MLVLKGLKDANIEWLEQVRTVWRELKRNDFVLLTIE